MIVKAIYKDENFDYFRDTQTKTKRVYGDIFECDDEIAEERIKKGLVKKATKEEKKEYCDGIDTNDDETPTNKGTEKKVVSNENITNEKTNNNENNGSKNNDKTTKVEDKKNEE